MLVNNLFPTFPHFHVIFSCSGAAYGYILQIPTAAPSAKPTIAPSSAAPTLSPSREPTTMPSTAIPSAVPSLPPVQTSNEILIAPDGISGDNFGGTFVSISGSNIVIGSQNDDITGAVDAGV